MGKIKAFFRNKWVGFTLASLLYTLWFVVWTGNLWMLLGLVVIFDLYISKFFYRYVWCHNVRLCQRSKTYKTVYEWVNAIIFATVVASLVQREALPDDFACPDCAIRVKDEFEPLAE